MRAESGSDILTGALEREVTEEQGVTGLAKLITIALAAVVLSLTIALLGVGEVDVHSATIEFGSLLGSMSFGGIGSVDEFNVSKTIKTG